MTDWRKAEGLEDEPNAYRFWLNGRLHGETEYRLFGMSDESTSLIEQGKAASACSSVWVVDTEDYTIIWKERH